VPAVGTYTYEVAGSESATGFGSRAYPSTMTFDAHTSPDAEGQVVVDLRFSQDHEEREILERTPDGLAFAFEGGSITFGPGTQTSEADYDPPMVQIPTALTPGSTISGTSAAKNSDGSTSRVEDWAVSVVGQETLDIGGTSVDTWVVDVQRCGGMRSSTDRATSVRSRSTTTPTTRPPSRRCRPSLRAERGPMNDITVTPERLFSFPNPVNEISARLVAAGVLTMAVVAVTLDQRWLVILLAYGFWARVLTGPKLSPLGLLVTRVVTPRLAVEPRLVPGPPKRFAQGIGVVFTTAAVVLTYGAHAWPAAKGMLVLMIAAAFLEAAFGLCLGCKVFALLMRVGVVPEDVCERCNNIWAPRHAPS